jgi:hypothetical protein
LIESILGYEIEPRASVERYLEWFLSMDRSDILVSSHVDRLAFNKATQTPLSEGISFSRIAEMHFTDKDSHERYLGWFEEHLSHWSVPRRSARRSSSPFSPPSASLRAN